MRVEAEYVLLISTIAALAGSGIGWNIRNGKVKEILLAFAHKESRLADQAKAVISEIKKECDAENDRARSLEERLRAAKAQNSKLVAKDKEFELALQQLKATNKSLHDTYTLAISKIKQECALLPSVVEWASQIQEIIDAAMVDSLARKDRPALKAAEEIKEARASARNWKKEADTLRNTVSLYEVEAPWLVELADYSVGEIVEGLRQEAELQKAAISGNDPARLFVSAAEWAGLTEAKRTQLALDRYWEYRKRNAWAAGIQYERFVGYSYETIGFNVIYQGATKGVNDQGIDLICAKNSQIHLIQWKRLSVEKGFPVNRPGFCRHSRAVSQGLLFKLYRRQALVVAMPAHRVVEQLDVVEHIRPRLVPGRVDLALHSLPLEQLEEALGHGVVVAVSATTHAADHLVILQESLPLAAGELAALIGVQHQAGRRFATPYRRQERLHHHIAVQRRPHRPAHHLSREQVDHHGQVQPAFVRAQVGDVRHPVRVGFRRLELPIKMIRRHRRRLAAVMVRPTPIADLRLQAFGPHQPRHSMLAAGFALLAQVVGHFAIAVDRTALQPRLLHQAQQSIVFPGTHAHWRAQPRVVAAAMHPEHTTHRLQPELVRVIAHEGVLHPDSLAKYAAAFFRMSRSSVTRLSSA